jgi:hypothetical protein
VVTDPGWGDSLPAAERGALGAGVLFAGPEGGGVKDGTRKKAAVAGVTVDEHPTCGGGSHEKPYETSHRDSWNNRVGADDAPHYGGCRRSTLRAAQRGVVAIVAVDPRVRQPGPGLNRDTLYGRTTRLLVVPSRALWQWADHPHMHGARRHNALFPAHKLREL